jgi:hypothetical protein
VARKMPGEGFDEFVRTRSARLLRAALAMTGDRQTAEDLASSPAREGGPLPHRQ